MTSPPAPLRKRGELKCIAFEVSASFYIEMYKFFLANISSLLNFSGVAHLYSGPQPRPLSTGCRGELKCIAFEVSASFYIEMCKFTDQIIKAMHFPLSFGEGVRGRGFYGHSPFVKLFTPAHPASHALPYVFLSQPQTGSYCFVHMQSGLAGPTHSELFVLQVAWQQAIRKNAAMIFFIMFKFMR